MRFFTIVAGAMLLAGSPLAAAEPAPRCWIATWASSQQIPEPHNALPDEDLRDATLRQVVRTTIGGPSIRLRISNLFGTEPLRIGSVRVARSADPASARIESESARPVSFSGHEAVTIPAGAEYVSDPVELAVAPMSHVAISMHLPEPPARQTSHPGSRATSYLVHGDRTGDGDLRGAKTVDHWYQIARLSIAAPNAAAALAVIGDSITDGFGVKPNSDTRWPDYLARRMQASPDTRHLALINLGKGGNRILLDGLGPNMLARFERDVLDQPGVRYFVILGGVNDLGSLTREAPASAEAHKAMVDGITGAYRQMVLRARERGVKAIGATILPFGGSGYYHPDAATEADRQAINAWIRAPGNFDAVIDFDAVMRSRSDPTRLDPAYDSGDGLHPSIAGYEAMAAAVPLDLFTGAGSGCAAR